MSIKTTIPEDQSSAAEINLAYGFILIDGKDFIVNLKNHTLSPVVSIRNLMANRFAFDENGDPIGKTVSGEFRQDPAFDDWMKSPKRKTFMAVVFDPSCSNSDDEFNLYRGMSVAPADGYCDLILGHIYSIWCRDNPAAYEYVISWLARMVQMPWKQGQTIVTLASDEGTGKGIITDMLCEFFKHHNLLATHQRDIVGRFNDKLATSIFICMNEAIWGGNKADEGILKTLATDQTLTIEKKFVQKFAVNNCTHIIITSNNDFYAPVDRTDRRYLTLTLDNTIIGNYAYFDALMHEIKSGGKEAFLHFLMNFDISKFQPRNIPKVNSEERARLKVEGADSMTTWLIDLVNEGELTEHNDDSEFMQIDHSQWMAMPIEVHCKQLRNDYIDYANRRKQRIKSGTAFGTFIKKTFSIERTRLSTDGRPWTYVLPKLSECREIVTAHLGGDSPFDEKSMVTMRGMDT